MVRDPNLLHGMLWVTIFEINKLHTKSGWGFNLFDKKEKKFLSQVKRLVLREPENVGSRLYATVDLDRARVARTRMITNKHSHPRWNESFRIYCAHKISNVVFTIKDGNPIGETLIGRAYLPVKDIIFGHEVDRLLDIVDEQNHPIYRSPKIRVNLKFFDVTKDSNWSQGIKIPSFGGVPYTFFMQREGCKVTLYQDAHVPDLITPEFNLSEGNIYEPHKCWEDIFDVVTNARHLIYITGWSKYTKITLIRDPKRPRPQGNITLGDLLKKKADEGVRVLMLVWDDRTSATALRADGLVATNNQEIVYEFRNSRVRCFLCPRDSDDASIVQGFQIKSMFTHHQKTIVVDSEMPEDDSQKRRIVSFVGGIDLCDGRYDTPDHSLFKTLDNIHNHDFHQPNFRGSSIRKGGPREPWHDIHCKLEGPVALDVLYNFEQRWKKQVGNKFLLTFNELDRIITRPPTPITSTHDPETWNVQIFRSIDSAAVEGFPHENHKKAAKDHEEASAIHKEATEIGLVTEMGNTIDRSIQDAYINAIRRAKNFIYMESQYFIGSSYGWNSKDIKDADIGSLHLIPKELSLKIVSKIEAGERFTVYVVIPMWPEGIPESASVQAILDWQRRTMEMMYTDIYDALRAKGMNENLRDYLTFFCLGNREAQTDGEYVPIEKPDPYTNYHRAQLARRFMIYVHANMMIVDDEYIIIGSANINQRSMDGARDTEIAMGGYQPHHLSTDKPARGQIYGFRIALWYEHLGVVDEAFRHPEILECVTAINTLADGNWKLYASHDFHDDLPFHLLKYPVAISDNGNITTLPGFEFFPDTEARILGNKSKYLSPFLTT
ncbi:Phospholipase D alpha 1 [Camellia lanceoleosa]|uniref:Phospholipase D alpha 1 n=1 Tax=Camellia lanceoleosa TaxID=1840588 RepID=A0ACC0G644_9ERIC|nr:Phospholipase D alpha 1 [Camellia lanceoleosa]